MSNPDPTANLVWRDSRWHCQGRPIHAGESLEIRARHTYHYDNDGEPVDDGPGAWLLARIESKDRGRVLLAMSPWEGMEFTMQITAAHEMRWYGE